MLALTAICIVPRTTPPHSGPTSRPRLAVPLAGADPGLGSKPGEKSSKADPVTLTGEAARAELRNRGQYDSLGEALAAGRHAVEEIDPGGPHSRGAQYFAANPGQQLRAWFSADGVELASGLPTSGHEDPWSLKLRLREAGRDRAMERVDPGTLNAQGSRVEMMHEGLPVTEWFENRAGTLEQGFTLDAAPRDGRGDLVLALSVEGSLRARPSGEQDRICFVDATDSEVLHYTSLKAWDADGRTLPARMEVRGPDSIALCVSDEEAVYPVTIDPFFVHAEAKLFQDPVAGDLLGASVTLVGDVAVLGAPASDTLAGADAGAAHVFVRTGTTWTREARLIASDGAADDDFGFSVALSGNTAVIGAPAYHSVTSFTESLGKAYIFVRDGTNWNEQAVLTASDGAIGDSFGWSVAIDLDTVVVGAQTDDTPAGQDAGGAYVFTRTGTAWSEQAKLVASDGEPVDIFGCAVAVDGDTALVGASLHNAPGQPAAGAAYVFTRTGTAWTQQAKLTAHDGLMDDDFGEAVALEGDTALIGAPGSFISTTPGKAYVFVRSGNLWSLQQILTSSDANTNDEFGYSVALSGNTALIGAPLVETTGGKDAGSAYVFEFNGIGWTEEAILSSDEGATRDNFGDAVALSGGTILIGVYGDDTEAGSDAGSAEVFVGSGGTWELEAKLITSETNIDDGFGISVALSEDTVLVGVAADDSPAGTEVGSAYLFIRGATTWAQQAKLTASTQETWDFFGLSVALSTDTALVGAPGDNTASGLDTGGVHVFVRNGSEWILQAELEAGTPTEGSWFGNAVSLSGETALIGSQTDRSLAGSYTGSAYIFERHGTTWTEQAKLEANDAQFNDHFGVSVSLSGDTALIGAYLDNTPSGTRAGSAYVFVRSGMFWSLETKLSAPDGEAGDEMGRSVAISGDTALVGSYLGRSVSGPNTGCAHVFVRNGGTWTPQAKLSASDAAPSDQFGLSVALLGDTALVGAPLADTAAPDAGSAYLFVRDGTVWNEQVKLSSGVEASHLDNFGHSLALLEGTAAVGIALDDDAGLDAGSVYVIRYGELPEVVTPPQSRTVVPGQPVTFDITVTGYEPLRYQWRKDGYAIEGETGTSLTIPSAALGDQGHYDCVVSNIGGVVTSAAATLAVNDLSEFTQSFPGSPPEALGFVFVNLTPAGIGGGWRFAGEKQWRLPGIPAGGLTTGDRVIEFRPLPGYIHPPAELVSVSSGGAATVVERSYYEAGMAGSGGLSVTLKPDALADPGVPEAERAQWRFLGESDTQWRNSGTTVADLVSGNYLVECKPVSGRITPPPASVPVGGSQTAAPVGGSQTAAPILTYFLENAQTGTPPGVLGFETVSTSTELPYAYVGQIRSAVGSSTGFVVKERVVATAGHVVFDDGTLSAVTDLQWLFQRDRGTYEPKPQIPRGFYLFDGYSIQRALEGTPGSSSPASQELDAAALYFDDPAGRGGSGGFLASDASPNEWLISHAQKVLVGYPVEGVPASQAGRMHATPEANVGFTTGGSAHTYTTSEIRSSGGTSGGPLCVQFEGGSYYPAAIYLGGTGQTVVRVIDSEVIRLFDAAEDSAATGSNNTGGGITLTSVAPVGSPDNPGGLHITIAPPEAMAAGAGWRMVPDPEIEPGWRRPQTAKQGLGPGIYYVELTPVAGFKAPVLQSVEVEGGIINGYTYTYVAENPELEAWRLDNFPPPDDPDRSADLADPDRDGLINIDEFIAGTDPNDRRDNLAIVSMERIGTAFALTVHGKKGRIYEMQLYQGPHSGDPDSPGQWSTRVSVGPLDVNAPNMILSDPANPADTALYRVRVSKP